jgi:hypothetical protein
MRWTVAVLTSFLLATFTACGHTHVTLRETTADEVIAAVTSAWSPNASRTRHDESDGTVTIEGNEGDNGASAWTAIFTLGLFWSHTIAEDVKIAPERDGVSVAVRVSRWTQILYVFPVIQRYEEREAELLQATRARLAARAR